MSTSLNRADTWPPAGRSRLAALREKKPQRKAAQIRAFWPDIKVALANGHSYDVICECLEAAGVSVTVKSLSSYVSRIRRKESTQLNEAIARSPQATTTVARREAESRDSFSIRDPLANLREREGKQPAFDYRPESADAKKLI